jgi:hypothetical protein
MHSTKRKLNLPLARINFFSVTAARPHTHKTQTKSRGIENLLATRRLGWHRRRHFGRFAPPNGFGRFFGRHGGEFAFGRDGRHLLGTIFFRRQGMPTFLPSAPTGGFKLDHRVHGYFRQHALLHIGITKVSHQALQGAHMAHHNDRDDLLFNINHYGIQTAEQVAITFATRESVSAGRTST